jgi:acetoin utilization deacetylase AcuC-like enzyme
MVRAVLDRWTARRKELPVWYHPQYTMGILGMAAGNLQPRRGDFVVGRLEHDGLLRPREVRAPGPVSLPKLALFHPWPYIDACTQPEVLARIFGLQPSEVDVEAIWTSVRLAVSGTVEASRWAAERGAVAFNMGGGFHHAEPGQGSGFCLFNDVGVAIQNLRQEGFDDPVLIVDLDVHQGNGNSAAFSAADRVTVYSIHGSVWSHAERPDHREIHLTGPVNDRRYLACLRTTLVPLARRLRPRLMVFIAGADVLAEDRLGTFWLTLAGVAERDRLVHELAGEIGAGLVVTLGGGYSRAAWLAHYNFARYLITGRLRVSTDPVRELRRSFDEVASRLDPLELQGGDELGLDVSVDELFGELERNPSQTKFLGYYSRHGVELGLERYGVFDQVRARGFEELQLDIEVSDPQRQVVRVRGSKGEQWYLLMELIVRLRELVIEGDRFRCLHVDWVLLQDPTASFTLERPRLPGQEHVGLGISTYVTELFVRVCHRLDLAGVVDNPSHLHNGLGAPAGFRFLSPLLEGRARALRAALADVPITEASWAMEEERVVTRDGEVVRWIPGDHILPLREDLREVFERSAYRAEVEASRRAWERRGIQIKDSTASIEPNQ